MNWGSGSWKLGLRDDLIERVRGVVGTAWRTRDGVIVPEPATVQLGNDAVRLNAAVLYADLAESTALVDNYRPEFAAEVYKSYLVCAARLIREHGGEITAYDGDRVMAIFLGDDRCSRAAQTALQINFAVLYIINPEIRQRWDIPATFDVRQAVGIDVGALFVARTGIRGANDLVWVGRAANYAAKLCELREGTYASWITEDVYDQLTPSSKYWIERSVLLWEPVWGTEYGKLYRSNWWWNPDYHQ